MKIKPHFDLISKPVRQKFIEYKGDAVRLSLQTPATVEEVVLGLKGRNDLKRKITTFRDSDGEIIERAFDYFDKPYRNRLYTKNHNFIEDEFVVSKTTKDYVLDRSAMTYYKDLRQFPQVKRTILWAPVKTETNHIAENGITGEKIFSQVREEIVSRQKNRKRHIFIEFPPLINNKIQKKEPKFLSFTVRNKDYSVIQNSIKSQGVKVPENDDFLGFRALTKDDAKEPFCKQFLRESQLENVDITINPFYNPIYEKDSNFTAIFDAENGIIKFNKDYAFRSKSQIIKTSAHESEHVKQYFLQALLNGGGTPWQDDIAKKTGELKTPELIKEAKSYDKSIENYVPYWKNKIAYSNNFIEKLANKKGKSALKKYDSQGKAIRKEFPHIPKELL